MHDNPEGIKAHSKDLSYTLVIVLLLVLLLHTGIVLVSSTKWHRLSFPEKEKREYGRNRTLYGSGAIRQKRESGVSPTFYLMSKIA